MIILETQAKPYLKTFQESEFGMAIDFINKLNGSSFNNEEEYKCFLTELNEEKSCHLKPGQWVRLDFVGDESRRDFRCFQGLYHGKVGDGKVFTPPLDLISLHSKRPSAMRGQSNGLDWIEWIKKVQGFGVCRPDYDRTGNAVELDALKVNSGVLIDLDPLKFDFATEAPWHKVKLYINEECLLTGDASSLAIVFNNLTGVNAKNEAEYLSYVEMVKKKLAYEIETGQQLSIVDYFGNKTSGYVGDFKTRKIKAD